MFYFLICIPILDIIISFNTGFYKKGILETSRNNVFKNYL